MKHFILIAICVISLSSWAQESSFQNDFVKLIEANQQQVVSLVEVMPDETLDWGPGEGVRNTEKVVLHIAAANYFFPTVVGAVLPEGVDPRSFEAEISGKEEVMKTLDESYTFIKGFVQSLSEEALEEEVDYFDGSKATKRMVIMRAFGHCMEHMGQLVAYARSNDVTPPWSQKESSEK